MDSARQVIKKRGGAKGLGTDDLPHVRREDFENSLRVVKASVSGSDLGEYENWDRQYGASKV